VKVTLKPTRIPPDWRRTYLQWSKALPFVVNTRGLLVHRVRYAGTHLHNDGTFSHNSATFWCGNQANGETVSFVADPPENRLLCERCEKIAVAAGQPKADELAGRHVHVGAIKAQRRCCLNEQN